MAFAAGIDDDDDDSTGDSDDAWRQRKSPEDLHDLWELGDSDKFLRNWATLRDIMWDAMW